MSKNIDDYPGIQLPASREHAELLRKVAERNSLKERITRQMSEATAKAFEDGYRAGTRRAEAIEQGFAASLGVVVAAENLLSGEIREEPWLELRAALAVFKAVQPPPAPSSGETTEP